MKSRSYIFSATFVAALLGLIGCSQITPVDVADVAKDLAPGSFAGTETRSKTVVDGLTMTVDEWTISDAAASKIEYTQYAFGNGVQKEIAPVAYTYAAGQMAAGNLGINYVFTPLKDGAEPLDVLFWGNALIIKGDTVGDGAAPIVNLKKIDEAFSNTKWLLDEQEYHILYDTLQYEQRDTVKHVGVVDGKKQWIIDTIIVKTVSEINADTIGLKYHHTCNYAFLRDGATAENSGSRAETFEWYDMNEEKDDVKLVKDSVAGSNFHWGIDQIVSASRFALNLQDNDTKEVKRISLSGLDVTKKFSVNISNYDYKMVTEED